MQVGKAGVRIAHRPPGSRAGDGIACKSKRFNCTRCVFAWRTQLVYGVDWEAAFADQLARARQLGGLVIPRSFVLLGRVLAMLAGLLATYRPEIQIHTLIARHLATAIA